MVYINRISKSRTNQYMRSFLEKNLDFAEKPEELLEELERFWKLHKSLEKPTFPFVNYYKKDVPEALGYAYDSTDGQMLQYVAEIVDNDDKFKRISGYLMSLLAR